jgi:hypothetical protein
VSGLDGVDVPRRNGELVFDAPWQSRAFGMAAAVVETRFGKDWGPFRSDLIAAIAADEERPYWEAGRQRSRSCSSRQASSRRTNSPS